MTVHPAYEKLKDIMELEVVQWGNTVGDGTVKGSTCQHGVPECKTMQIYACHKYTSTPDDHASFVECFDSTLMKAFPKGLPEGTVNTTFAEASLKGCATAMKVDYATLDKCSTSAEGAGYFAKEKAKTPSHTGVPFVSIDGAPIVYNSQNLTKNLVETICKAYKGRTPAACGKSNTTETEDFSYSSLITLA